MEKMERTFEGTSTLIGVCKLKGKQRSKFIKAIKNAFPTELNAKVVNMSLVTKKCAEKLPDTRNKTKEEDRDFHLILNSSMKFEFTVTTRFTNLDIDNVRIEMTRNLHKYFGIASTNLFLDTTLHSESVLAQIQDMLESVNDQTLKVKALSEKAKIQAFLMGKTS